MMLRLHLLLGASLGAAAAPALLEPHGRPTSEQQEHQEVCAAVFRALCDPLQLRPNHQQMCLSCIAAHATALTAAGCGGPDRAAFCSAGAAAAGPTSSDETWRAYPRARDGGVHPAGGG